MKNKRLIGIIAALAVLVAGSLIYSSMNKPEAKNEKKVAKVGVLQFVSHPSLDLIYKGIQDGLAEEGYKDDQVKIDFMNSEGDQSKVATMSKQLVANGYDLVVGIATPAAQGLASATTDLPVIMAAITDPIGANLVIFITFFCKSILNSFINQIKRWMAHKLKDTNFGNFLLILSFWFIH